MKALVRSGDQPGPDHNLGLECPSWQFREVLLASTFATLTPRCRLGLRSGTHFTGRGAELVCWETEASLPILNIDRLDRPAAINTIGK